MVKQYVLYFATEWWQEIWPNAQEMRQSLWQLLFAGNLGLSSPVSSQFTLLQPKIAKKSLKTLTLGFKVNNVDITKKHAIGACYDKQHVCTYLQSFLH